MFPLYCIVSSLIYLFFGVICYVKNKVSVVNKLWSLSSFSIAIWSFGLGMMVSASNLSQAQLWLTIHYFGALLIPSTFFHYIVELIGKKDKYRWLIWFWHSAFFILSAVNLFEQSWLVAVSERKPFFKFYTDDGMLYLTYVALFALCIVFATGLLIDEIVKCSSGFKRKNQLEFMLLATLFGFIGGGFSFLPVFNSQIYPFGLYFVVLYPCLMTYAILRYQLLDIEVIIKRTLVFAGIVAAAVSVITLPFALIQVVIGKTFWAAHPFILMAIGTATAVLIYRPVERVLVRLTDKYLFQKKYDYHKLLKENSKQIAFIHSLDELAKQVVVFLIKQGRVRNAGLFTCNSDSSFKLRYPLGYGGRAKRPSRHLEAGHFVIQALIQRQTPLVREVLEKEPKQSANENQKRCLRETLEWMKEIKAEVLIPSFLRSPNDVTLSELTTILVLGGKKSDEPYSEEDLNVFYTIAQESAIAAENARLLDVLVKEQKSKIKAEDEAERVHYAKTIAHEIKNAVSGIYGPAISLQDHVAVDMDEISANTSWENSPSWVKKKFLEIRNRVHKLGGDMEKYANKIRVIAVTVEGTLKSNADAFEDIYFRVVWEAAKRQVDLSECEVDDIDYPDNFIIYGNVVWLENVFINLLKNAMEAMILQGKKKIGLKGSYETIDSKRGTQFEITDSGPGIPREIIQKIFEQDFSTKPVPQKGDIDASGYGQGLFVCKKTIQDMHHGKIWVENVRVSGAEIVTGASFKFWIPLKPD